MERNACRTFASALSLLLLFASFGLGGLAHANAVTIHKFSGADGSEPYGPLVEDAAGNLFGTTIFGGSDNAGVVFELSPGGNGSWTETVLHSFTGADGSAPTGGLATDSKGDLYGTTFTGGPNGGGVAFALSPNGGGAWTFALLNAFGGPQSPGGSNPNGDLVRDSAGNLYGTTQLGGTGICTNFPGPCGIVFELSPSRGGAWSETVLWSFHGIPDGSFPAGGVVLDASGNLYGTTNEGGSGKCTDGEGTTIGCGTVFSLVPSNGSWSETLLYNFKASEQNMPGDPLVFARNGSLVGVAGYDIFRLKQAKIAGSWEKETIYEFTEGIGGTIPAGGVIFDRSGNLYVPTSSSGLRGYSTASELSPPAKRGGVWMQTTLAKFAKGFSLNQPRGALLLGSDGNLYGAINGEPGSIFAIAR